MTCAIQTSTSPAETAAIECAIWVVIPVHNNAATVRRVALECREFVPNVLVIDDGSTDADVTELLADTGIQVIKHAVNQGKGSAILTAALAIEARGGEIMITIDGDGQHFPEDLPSFLDAAAKDPNAIIVGERDMSGENVPESSRFGRRFSDFWIRLETGMNVADTQSGFRAYPVKHILALGCIGKRYDFEIEVLTRGAWAGLPLRNVSIKVWYPPRTERVSSFRPFLDNLWITHRHVLLVCRRALPIRHRRLVTEPKTTAPRVRGNALGFWFFATALHLTGLRGAYGLLFFVCAWYTLFDRPIVKATLAYLKRRYPAHGTLRQLWNVYHLFIAQGRCFIDRRYLMHDGKKLRFRKCDFDRITPLLEQKEGFLLLTAHAGNWQIAMASIEGWKKQLRLLMRPNLHPTRDKELHLYDMPDQVRMIDATGYLGGTLEVMAAIEEGCIVSVMGDRGYEGRTVPVTFFGDTAEFPCSGFVFAHATRRPMAVLLSAKTGPYNYDVQVAGIIEVHPGERKQAFIQRGAQEFANILEDFFKRHPLQCFLFQDIWASGGHVTF